MSNKDELHKALDNVNDPDMAMSITGQLSNLTKAVLTQGRILEEMLSDSPATSHNKLLLTPAEVALMFGVDPKTVTRWAKQGKIEAHVTLGGHRRYMISEVRGLLKSHSSKTQKEVAGKDAQVS